MAVTQTMTLRSLYEYVSSLTRPVTILLRNRGSGRAVPQTETLPTLYQYVGSLTRPVTIQFKNRGSERAVPAGNAATNLVPIRWFPNPPGIAHLRGRKA